MALAKISRFALAFLVVICTGIISVESSPRHLPNVAYTRYVRRIPTRYSREKYYNEVLEVFNTRRRPPPFFFLHDIDLTRFVQCDYDPSLPGCDGEISTTSRATSTPKVVSEDTTTITPPTTSTTTNTVRPWGASPTIAAFQPPTTTEQAMIETTELPEIKEYDDEDEYEDKPANNEEYGNESVEESEPLGEDDNFLTDENEAVDDVDDDDDDDDGDADIDESKSTAKSLFRWF